MPIDNNGITLPVEFSGPAQLVLYTRYGDPRSSGWINKWITEWDVQKKYPWFPSKLINIHKHFWPLLETAFAELEAAGLHQEIETCDSCHDMRNAEDDNIVLSVHCWGAAIDLNAAHNPTGSLGAWSPGFIEIMERNDIFCGQSWSGRKSPQHFAMVDG